MIKIVKQNILSIMVKQGVKHSAIAKKAGYSVQQFSDMLYGRRIFRDEDVIRVANALGVTPNDLFGFTNNKTA